MKKKFLLYVAVIVTLLFLGFTIYYLSINDEVISLAISSKESMYINVDDSFHLPIKWTKPSNGTKLTVSGDNDLVLSYDEETKMFTGIGGGYTTITISTSNPHYGPFVFQVYVGDGSVQNPFAIKSVSDLANIGQTTRFTSSKCYVLAEDLDLSSYNGGVWTPIETFSGHFNGNGHSVYYLTVNSAEKAGLFKEISHTGIVENLRLQRVNISGTFNFVGAVAGVNNGTIGKVEVVGDISNQSATGYTGLIAGANKWDSSAAYVNMCSASGTITTNAYAGGLVGYNHSSIIINSRAIVSLVTGGSGFAGGLIGVNESIITEQQEYYPTAVVKAYAVVNQLSGNAVAGGLVGNNIDNNNGNSVFYNKFQNVYYAKSESIGITAFGQGFDDVRPSEAEHISFVTKEQLLVKTTYQNFNFESVWTKETNDYAKIDMLGSYETIFIKGLKKEITQEEMSLIEFLHYIKDDPSNDSVYIITANEGPYDLSGEEWQTIAPDAQNPMLASIVSEDGSTCVVKNFRISGNNSSFFGYVSGNASINGLIFENVSVDNDVTGSTAVVVTGLYGSAKLSNVTVNELSLLKTRAKNVGIICAENRATIESCTVTATSNKTVTVYAQQELVNYGTIAGYNSGYISKCRVTGIKLETNTSNTSNGSFNIGGIVGITEGNIYDCGVNSFLLTSAAEGTMYVGGVVGNTTNATNSISYCYSKANIDLGLSNSNAYVGGIVAYVAENTKVVSSLFADGTVRARNVAGLVSVNRGKISMCYNKGTVTGVYVAGMAVNNYGEISNCYCLSTLNGESNDGVVNGLVKLLASNSVVDRCFVSATFTGRGSRYAETESPFRWEGNTITPTLRNFLLGEKYSYGQIENCVIINYGNATIQTYNIIFVSRGNWIEANEAQCRGENNYSIFKESAKFDVSVWSFETEGEYPLLKDIATID